MRRTFRPAVVVALALVAVPVLANAESPPEVRKGERHTWYVSDDEYCVPHDCVVMFQLTGHQTRPGSVASEPGPGLCDEWNVCHVAERARVSFTGWRGAFHMQCDPGQGVPGRLAGVCHRSGPALLVVGVPDEATSTTGKIPLLPGECADHTFTQSVILDLMDELQNFRSSVTVGPDVSDPIPVCNARPEVCQHAHGDARLGTQGGGYVIVNINWEFGCADLSGNRDPRVTKNFLACFYATDWTLTTCEEAPPTPFGAGVRAVYACARADGCGGVASHSITVQIVVQRTGGAECAWSVNPPSLETSRGCDIQRID